jgi:hypothetical protein
MLQVSARQYNLKDAVWMIKAIKAVQGMIWGVRRERANFKSADSLPHARNCTTDASKSCSSLNVSGKQVGFMGKLGI